jgi:aspartyl-tRNA(Asn)/glutamyl-tRNA(Gln) amidotransferase subunit A
LDDETDGTGCVTMSSQDVCFLSALELLQRYRDRGLSPVEATDAIIDQIERWEPSLNAFVTETFELARAQARHAEDEYASDRERPLLGVPVTIKDITATKGIRTTRGSLLFKDDVPEIDAPVVERMKAAGAIILGKTTTPELGWKGDSGNRVNGPAYNPWNLERTPGGSSGGASAAVAAGFGPIAQGTDGAGSIRIPAAFTGVYGIKASFGLVPNYPPSAVALLAHNGPLSRTVRDSALALNVMAGPDPRDKNSLGSTGIDYLAACDRPIDGLRIAWSPDLGYAPVHPDVAELTAQAARLFEDMGCTVEEVDPGIRDPYPELDIIWKTAQAAGVADNFNEVRDLLDPGRVPVVEAGFSINGIEMARAYAFVLEYADRWQAFMRDYDLLLTPALPVTAFKAGDDHPGDIEGVPSEYLSWTRFTYPFNITGQPAATVPCGLAGDGLPVGLQIVGRWRDDATVLAASAAFETARPWVDKIPTALASQTGG